MLTKFTIVGLNDGLDAKNASDLVNLTSKYSSFIKIIKRGEEANAKSIAQITMLSIRKSEELTIVVDGIDQIKAIESVYKLLANE